MLSEEKKLMTRSRWIYLATALLIGFALCQLSSTGRAEQKKQAFSENDQVVVSGETGQKLDEYLTRLSRFGFSGAALVAKDGKVVLQKAYGYADQSRKMPNTNQTAFDIASLTKQFTAAAILKLEAQGKLKTGDPISKYLPDVPVEKAQITIHQLLTHTSGFNPDFPEGKNVSRRQFIAAILKMPLVAKPGKEYIYANSGYCLLAAIVEEVSGKAYPQFVAEELYKPAGMTRTGCYDDSDRWRETAVAHAYNDSADNGLPTAKPTDWGVRGAYDALTTTGDLYRWITALRKNSVLPESATRKMFSSQVPTNDRGVDYGYGWQVAKDRDGKKVISHGGSHFDGFNASVRWDVDRDVIVIIISNRIFGRLLPLASVEPAFNSIIFRNRFPEVPETPASWTMDLTNLAGTYVFPDGAKWEVAAEDDHLTISAVGQQAIDLLVAANSAEQKRQADFNRRAAAVFNGIAKGDLSEFSKEFKNQAQLERLKPQVSALWKRFEAGHGGFQSLEVIGTVPETEALMTYVKLNFERGSEYRRCRWEDGKLAYILLGEPPFMPTWFVPQSKTDFVGYHVVLGKTVRISFGSAEKAGLLTVHTGKGETIGASKQ